MAQPLLPDLSSRADRSVPRRARQVPSTSMIPTNHLEPVVRKMAYGPRKLELKLKKKPKDSIIIEGFPGFGFVATIAVEYLMDHLKTHSIGNMWSPRLAPIAFIHDKRIVQPLEIFHNDKYNIIVLEAVAGVAGMEWEVADSLLELYKKVNAKEIISIEGIGSPVERKEPVAYYQTNQESTRKKLESIGLGPVKEGIIFGVSGALMLKANKDVNATFIFAETHSNLPDSRAAAKIIQILDKYLDLKVDYKPLLKKAAEFEERLKGLMEKTKEAGAIRKEKEQELPYIG